MNPSSVDPTAFEQDCTHFCKEENAGVATPAFLAAGVCGIGEDQ
jgi:hypothetical protein